MERAAGGCWQARRFKLPPADHDDNDDDDDGLGCYLRTQRAHARHWTSRRNARPRREQQPSLATSLRPLHVRMENFTVMTDDSEYDSVTEEQMIPSAALHDEANRTESDAARFEEC